MKSLPICLSFSAAVLVAANFWIRRPAPNADAALAPNIERTSPVTNSPAQETTVATPSTSTLSSTKAAEPSRPPPIVWAKLETTDYKQYVTNLQSVGFPQELIREMIKADIEAVYAPREALLRP